MSEKASGEISIRQLVGYIKTALGLKYSKPSSGIPKTDLAADVQTSLGKADTALQQHQSLSDYQTKAITDTGNYYTTDTVEGALQEIGGKLLPSGGSTGDFLRKTASGVAWQTVPSAESNSFGGGST